MSEPHDNDPAARYARAASRKEAANATSRKKSRWQHPYVSAACGVAFVILAAYHAATEEMGVAVFFLVPAVLNAVLAWKNWPERKT